VKRVVAEGSEKSAGAVRARRVCVVEVEMLRGRVRWGPWVVVSDGRERKVGGLTCSCQQLVGG
jgi:hypothetical protein